MDSSLVKSFPELTYGDATPQIVFMRACRSSNLDVAQYITNQWPNLCSTNILQMLFMEVCESNRCVVAKWLLTTWPTIDYKFNNHQTLIDAYLNGANDIIKWLISLYRENDFVSVINAYYDVATLDYIDVLKIRNTKIDLIEYMIRFHDIKDLTINDKYQTEFDLKLQKIHCLYNLKSAI